jgi:hypothetical protein
MESPGIHRETDGVRSARLGGVCGIQASAACYVSIADRLGAPREKFALQLTSSMTTV